LRRCVVLKVDPAGLSRASLIEMSFFVYALSLRQYTPLKRVKTLFTGTAGAP
jgi:hypothetical protein